MPRWRKMTWAILIWTALMVIWLIGGVNAANAVPAGTNAEQTGRAIGTGIGVTFIFVVWLLGFLVLSVIWFASRPHNNVAVYGPNGQQVMVSEKEARKRVEKQGWSYQPRG